MGVSTDQAIRVTACPACGAARNKVCERLGLAPSTGRHRTHQARIQQAGRILRAQEEEEMTRRKRIRKTLNLIRSYTYQGSLYW
jgi:hypothetical protein